jgi:L-fuconolactonase
MQTTTDAYAHCGLSKYEPIESLCAVLAAACVQRAVLVQHLGEFDNRYIADIARHDPHRFAAVGMIDPARADLHDSLHELSENLGCRGVRLTANMVSVNPGLLDLATRVGLHVMLWAPDGLTAYSGALEAALERAPETRLVISHLGTPREEESPTFTIFESLKQLSRYPHVYVLVSGMKMSCPFPHEPLYPLIEQVIELFGPRRLMWGSNFPVVGGLVDYRADLGLLLEGKLPIGREDIQAVAGGNARRLWFGGEREEGTGKSLA